MTDKEKIKAEVKRLKAYYYTCGYVGQGEYENGNKQGRLDTCDAILSFIDSLPEEPVSEDLEDAITEYTNTVEIFNTRSKDIREIYITNAFKYGAKWQAEQLEKNRLTACDAQTEEEAGIERDFVMGIIEKEHRQPTFDDAIKYGMRLQRENMMKEAVTRCLPTSADVARRK